ncbi:hypothetical protein PISMIDRAFT_10524 [Pisolithus microcarpus 441]|uniref:Uncharacterized protein n=1 Tax=Pisolithus microcarpus 441 TaxID=765257 RepID=A0A0C9ZW74_9AGAM|nr:hypothetical protein PISMIDRAFT_10524 [Pisolithus microcarpus 441]
MSTLVDKILANFLWWADLHSFWRTNPSYNTVFSMANPGQDFAAGVQQYFSGGQSTAAMGLPLVGNGWVSGNPSPVNDDPSAEGEEGLGSEEEDLGGNDVQASPIHEGPLFPLVNTDNNIDPLLRFTPTPLCDPVTTPISPPPSTYSQVTTSSIPFVSEDFSWPVVADTNTPSTAGVLQALIVSKNKGKAKASMDAGSLSVPQVPSSSGSSTARKQPRDVGSEVSAKLSKTSDSLVCQIQNSAEAKSEAKRMKIQAQIVGKELKACDKHAQHEHDLKMRMMENKHERSMANEKTKQLELELRLEEARIAWLEAEKSSGAIKKN